MKDSNILKVKLPTLLKCLKEVLKPSQVSLVEQEIHKNVKQLIRLSESHLRFASQVNGKGHWRQQVSRAYYCCYNASKAVRLAVHFVYNTDISDHKKIDELPDDFPNKPTWQNTLTKFRGDRCLADYDHTNCVSSLEKSSSEYFKLSQTFLLETKNYLKKRGFTL